MEGVAAVFAEWDNNTRSVRSKDGMVKRVREGMWVWAPPLGFYKPMKGKSTNIHPEPERAPYLLTVFEEYSKECTPTARSPEWIGDRGLRTKAGKMPSPQLIEKILRNPVYCGRIEAFGEINKGTFAPIVSESLFDLCQNVGSKGAVQARSTNNPLFPLRSSLRVATAAKCSRGADQLINMAANTPTITMAQRNAPSADPYPERPLSNNLSSCWMILPQTSNTRSFLRLLFWMRGRIVIKSLMRQILACEETLKNWNKIVKKFLIVTDRENTTIMSFGTKNFINQRIQEKSSCSKTRTPKRLKWSGHWITLLLYSKRFKDLVRIHLRAPNRSSKTYFYQTYIVRRKKLWNPELSLVYQQKKTPFLESSPLVAPRGIEPLFSP